MEYHTIQSSSLCYGKFQILEHVRLGDAINTTKDTVSVEESKTYVRVEYRRAVIRKSCYIYSATKVQMSSQLPERKELYNVLIVEIPVIS